MMRRYDPAQAPFVRLGRFDPAEAQCALWWSGSGLRMRYSGAALEVEADAPDNAHAVWLAVAVDGEPVARFALRPGLHRCAVLERMDPAVAHEVTLTRDTQPHDTDRAPLRLTAVYADGAFEPAEPRPRLIEFIGDSLTVGEGTVGASREMEWVMTWISNQFAYPTLVSERMNAERRVVALGGWGTYKSWDDDPRCTINRIYDRLCAVVPGGDISYDFSAQRPADAVVINLGTNDWGAISRRDAADRPAEMAAVTRCAAELLEKVRATNPRAPILWAYGLCGDGLRASLERAVELRRAAGDEGVRYLALEDCAGDLGSRQHPSREAHRRAAVRIADALEDWLKQI